jgi:hypothetical protein
MGEQIPMDTIKTFVRAVWETDEIITKNGLPHETEVWSKPDARTGSLELRRITTRESIKSPPEFPCGVRTDFYELYWADLTAGSTWDEFTSWVRGLLFRPISRVPRGVRLAWVLLWLAALVVVAMGILAIAPVDIWGRLGIKGLSSWQWLIGATALGLLAFLHKVATATFGRVVRYTRADPENIASRQAVRERGLKLLETLHEGTNYKRIIIVAHSLGSILAHDLISYFWARRDVVRTIREDTPEFDALCALERAAAFVHPQNPNQSALEQYFKAQRELRLKLSARPRPAPAVPPEQPHSDPRWLITDFVTLGSPLTHAQFLLAADSDDLRSRIIARELPESPPFREDLDPNVLARAQAAKKLPIACPPENSRLMSYPDPMLDKVWHLHHAAPFAVVRWTNIYDPAKLVFFGDIIGGPLANALGPAIVDVSLRNLRGQSWSFTHTKYWTLNGDLRHIQALRAAVNLLDKRDSDPSRI